jgi:hypothetical protein
MPLSAALDTGCSASNGFACVQSVLGCRSDLMVLSCLMMARLLGGDKHKLLVWLKGLSDKQWRRSLCRLYVIEVMFYLASVILFFTKHSPWAIFTTFPSSQPYFLNRAEQKVVNTLDPIGQLYE